MSPAGAKTSLQHVLDRFRLFVYRGNPDHLPIDRRIFILLTFSGTIIALAGVVLNVLAGMTLRTTIVTALASAIVFAFYIGSLKIRDHYRLFFPFVALSLLLMCGVWFTNAGYDGNVLILFPVVYVVMHIAARSTHRRLVFVLFLLLPTALLSLHFFHRELITGYTDEMQRFIDLLVGNAFYLTFLYVVLHIMTSTYEQQAEVITKKSMQVKEEKQFSDLLLESLPGLVFFYEINSASPAQSRLVRFNRKHTELTGYTEEELRRMTLADWFEADMLRKIIGMEKKLAATGSVAIQLSVKIKTGAKIPYAFTGHLLTMGGKQYLLGVGLDVSDYVRTQQALRESEEKYRHLIEGLGDRHCVFIHTVEGKFIYVSQNFHSMFDVFPQNVIGRNWRELDLTPISLQAGEEAEQRVREKRSFERVELTVNHRDGSERIIEVSYGPVMEGNRLARIEGICTDITLQKRTEQALQQSQKLESIGTLAGGIAHDFNNLLGMIFGYIDLAAEETKEKATSEYLAKALKAFERIRGLTQQLLTFAKGGAPVKKVDAVGPFIHETAQFALSGSNVLCRFQLPDDLWMCEYDRNQIGQVIDNIIINAQQAMPKGGDVEISGENVALDGKDGAPVAPGKYVRISIKDHGVGISKDVLPRIFDPFYSTKAKGHGLGLATCYSIISRHGGRIDVESEPDKGSAFHVYLPASPAGPIPHASPMPVTQGSIATGTILIMDDEELIRDTLKAMLNMLGYAAISTRTGSEAIGVFMAEKEAGRTFSAMIFDLTIPGGIGGMEAISEIRKIDRTIPVFVASGYADDPVMSNPLVYGFTASISKPFRKSELGEMLGRYIGVAS
jgi:PAS domain S-box-containing protein